MVGGGDHSTGMFAVEFAQPDYDWDDGAYQNNIEFTFKKSVFFAGNYVVCLGSGITSSGSSTHITQVYSFYLEYELKYFNKKRNLFTCLYYYRRNFCNLIGLEQWYFSLI